MEKVGHELTNESRRWWAGAACIEIMTIILVLAMFWGSWTLENDLNLSPFNMALAFDSPLLQDIDSVSGAKGVVRTMGDTTIALGAAARFAIIHTPGSKDTLVLAPSSPKAKAG